MATRKPKAKIKKAGTSKEGREQRIHLFAEEYMSNGGNATQAAIAAGYGEKSAYKAGFRLSKDVHFLTVLDNLRTKTYSNLKITRERILQERARLAFFDPRKLLDKNGQPLPLDQLDDDTAAVIMGIDFSEEFIGNGEDRRLIGKTKKFKLANKDASLTSLEKQLGMYRPDNEQLRPPAMDTKDPIEIARAMAFILARGSRELDKKGKAK